MLCCSVASGRGAAGGWGSLTGPHSSARLARDRTAASATTPAMPHPLPLPLLLTILLLVPPFWTARVAVREAPKVQILSQGVVAGREVFVTRTQRARQYLGIPFAQPPVGALRFAPPSTSPLPSWDEPRNSTFMPACMQDRDRFEDHDKLRLELKLFPEDRIEFSEDCLYLNVYSPDGNTHSLYLLMCRPTRLMNTTCLYSHCQIHFTCFSY